VHGLLWLNLIRTLLKLSSLLTDNQVMSKTLFNAVGLILLLNSSTLSGQHSHGILTPGVTFPQDDSVLTDPPKMVTMSFRVDVRLLKLALYTAEDEWIDIGFTYDPNRMNHNFVLPIPFELPPSDYYVARWSVTDDVRGLVNGEFKFAYGPGAIPPSETIESQISDRVEVLPSTGAYRLDSIR
jgi:methionine-rich copper-binding protein CopC